MVRKRGGAWGNALGGYKRQPRKKNGQFASKGAKSAKRKTARKNAARAVRHHWSPKTKGGKKRIAKAGVGAAAGIVGYVALRKGVKG